MDHIIKRVEVDSTGAVDPASMDRLVESVAREVRRKTTVATGSSASAVPGQVRTPR
jgi:hypothetical protein